MVNVCLPEQRSLCFSNVCVLVLKTVRGWGGGGWVSTARGCPEISASARGVEAPGAGEQPGPAVPAGWGGIGEDRTFRVLPCLC